MPVNTTVKHLFFVLLLLCTSTWVQAQRNRNTQVVQKKDSLAMPSLELITDCTQGIHGLKIGFAPQDTLTTPPQYVQLYRWVEIRDESDTTADTIELVRSYSIDDIEKAKGTLYPDVEGKYYIRTAIRKNEKWETSLFTTEVGIKYCSTVNFPPVFELGKTNIYTPTLTNIQVVEFYIFDRVGTTVYSHRNNDIMWNGKNADGQDYPVGVYYFHCEYIDVANGGEQKSLSGMIELKH